MGPVRTGSLARTGLAAIELATGAGLAEVAGPEGAACLVGMGASVVWALAGWIGEGGFTAFIISPGLTGMGPETGPEACSGGVQPTGKGPWARAIPVEAMSAANEPNHVRAIEITSVDVYGWTRK
jgi:hypothetical protein